MSCAKPRASPRPQLRQVMNAERSHRTSVHGMTPRSPRQGLPHAHAARRRNRTSPEARRTEVRFLTRSLDRGREQTRRSAQSESRLAPRTHDPPPEMYPADICNPHVKDEHPMSRVASGFVIEVALDLTGGRCVHIATARFGQSSAARAGVLFLLGLATEPGPLMPPSSTRVLRSRSSLVRIDQDRSYRHST